MPSPAALRSPRSRPGSPLPLPLDWPRRWGVTYTRTQATVSWTHTPVGTPTTASVAIAVRDDVASVVDVTYGGTLMTFVRADVVALTMRQEVFLLNNPASGAQLVVGSLSATSEGTGIAITVTGSATSGQPANHAGATGDSTAPSVTVTSAVDRLVIGFVDSDRNNTDAQIAPGAGQTQRTSVSGPTTDRPREEATDEAGAASVVTNWTLTNATGWVAQGIDLSAAAAVVIALPQSFHVTQGRRPR